MCICWPEVIDIYSTRNGENLISKTKALLFIQSWDCLPIQGKMHVEGLWWFFKMCFYWFIIWANDPLMHFHRLQEKLKTRRCVSNQFDFSPPNMTFPFVSSMCHYLAFSGWQTRLCEEDVWKQESRCRESCLTWYCTTDKRSLFLCWLESRRILNLSRVLWPPPLVVCTLLCCSLPAKAE